MKRQWQVKGTTITGVSHLEKNIVNQDAIELKSTEDYPLILAIADGHGNSKSFRSHIGSQLAVQTATEEFDRFYHHYQHQFNIQANNLIKKLIKEELSKQIVVKWREKVNQHLQHNPLEIQRQQEEKARHNNYITYGATLLTVMITESIIVYFQLGDGDILCVDSQGNTTRPDIPQDERLIANATTSLCGDFAWQDIRFCLQTITDDNSTLPELVLVSTDGYANSFNNEDSFLQIGKDYLEMIREYGLNQVFTQIPNFLNQASQFSGDDITLGIIQRQINNEE